MATFLSPGTTITQIRKGPIAQPAISTAIGAFEGLAEKGALDTPTIVTSLDDASEVFGDQTALSFQKLWDALEAFFLNGGQACYVNRILGVGSAAATRSLQAGSSATAGSLSSSNGAFPAALVPGETFTGKVDGGGAVTVTVLATRATYTGAGATYAAVPALSVLDLLINGSPKQIVFTGAEATELAFLTTINNQLTQAAAIDNGAGEIEFLTDRAGSSASGSIVNTSTPAVLASLGLAVGAFTNLGPNNVADVSAVTATELSVLFNATFVGSTTAPSGTNAITWASLTTGVLSSVQFTAGTGVAKIPGFDLLVHSGTASSLTPTITVEASSPGAWGNQTGVKSTKVDTTVAKTTVVAAGVTSTLTLSATGKLRVGDTISITKLADTQRGIITLINGLVVTFASPITVPVGGYTGAENVVLETFNLDVYDKTNTLFRSFTGLRMSPLSVDNYFGLVVDSAFRTPITTTDLAPVVSDPRPVTDASPVVMSGGLDGAAPTDADYIGDQGLRTGIWAFDKVSDVNFISVPGTHGTNGAILLGLQAYCENRADVQGVYDLPLGLGPSTVKTYVETTANFAGSYEGAWWPNVKKVDGVTGAVRLAYCSGYIQGMIARTHRERNFGKAPAGIVDGQIQGIVGLEYDLQEGPDYDVIYPANVNGILNFPGQGFAAFGNRTFDPTGEYGAWNVQTIFNIVKRTIDNLTKFAVFEPNDEQLWQSITRIVSLYLRELRVSRVLAGTKDEDSFFVICDKTINTPLVVASGKVKMRVGLAPSRAAEFLDFTLEQDTSAII